MSNMKVAVIGVFNIGKNHLQSWAETEGAQLVAVSDLNPMLCEEAKQQFQIGESYLNYKELLAHSDAEIISVCLPTGLHEQVVTDCLRAGRHVICEKPPATTAIEAQRMYECAVQSGRQLGYSLQRRFTGAVRAVRQAVAAGRTGELLYAKAKFARHAPLNFRNSMWRFDRGHGGGSLLDLGIHMLDAVWFAMGCPEPVSATGRTSNAQVPEFCKRNGRPIPEDPADDTAIAWIRFANGAVLTLESSFGLWSFDEDVEQCELYGTAGSVRMYPGMPMVVDRNGRSMIETPQMVEGHSGVMKDFLESARTGRPPCVDGRQGVMLHKMLDAIMQSADENREVIIP